MRISEVVRVALLATTAISALSLPSATEALVSNSERNVAAFDAIMVNPVHETRVLSAAPVGDEDALTTPAPKKKHKKSTEATPEPADPPRKKKSNKAAKKEAAKKKAAEEEAARKVAEEEIVEEAEMLDAVAKATEEAEATKAPKKKKKKVASVTDKADVSGSAEKSTETKEKTATTEEIADQISDTSVKEKKIKGVTNEGVIDGSSEGTAEIDKIDPRNHDEWVSVYDDPPLLVIKASLYAFIAYNDSEVCDTFNMTMNAVEQKVEDNGRYSYHVVTYVNCTKNNEDETQGRFILNFIPEGKRLLLTECGHREEGEIVNWLRIKDEVPECMTPKQRKQFLAQPMKHIHASNGTDAEAVQTDFLSRLEEFDTEEVAIFSTATVALIAVIVVLVVFCIRKRKAQKDLERTIAGAKAEHAVEDDSLQTEEKVTKERKGLMDSAKAKSDDPDMEEGSFVNSPAVRV